MEIQPQLVLLQKTLLNIEGLGRQLYPELDLWKTAKPFLEEWMKDQIGPSAFLRHLKENAPLWAERLPKLPNMLYDILEDARSGNLKMQLSNEQIDQIKNEISISNKRTIKAITGSTLLITASILASVEFNFIPASLTYLPEALAATLGALLIFSSFRK